MTAFDIARVGLQEAQNRYIAAASVEAALLQEAAPASTLENYDSQTGRFSRNSLLSDSVIADGRRAYNVNLRTKQPFLALPTEGDTRFLFRFQRIEDERQPTQPKKRTKALIPALTWLQLDLQLDSSTFTIPFNFPDGVGYDDYISNSNATFNAALRSTRRNLADGSQTISFSRSVDHSLGIVNTTDNAFLNTHSTGNLDFNYQIYLDEPGTYDVTVTYRQLSNLGTELSSITRVVNVQAQTKQPNLLYLIEVDQNIFPSSALALDLNTVEVRVTQSHAKL